MLIKELLVWKVKMKKILKFEDKECREVALAGGKGSSLAHMTQFGISVPRGLVVSSKVYDEVVDDKVVKGLLKNIDIKNIDAVNMASQKLRDYIQSLKITEKIENDLFKVFEKQNLSIVAVRSSATSEDTKDASWAGELKTILNTNKSEITEKIKECWASLFSPRALLYRLEKGFSDQQISVAVVIQEMVQSEISGVCFTIHPVTNRKSHMVIEAVYGLGEAIVSGQITPDQYLYDKDYDVVLRAETKKQKKQLNLPENIHGIMWKNTPADLKARQKITYKQILDLANICKKVEAYYGLPQDIEWAFWNNSFYILQSRPITTT
jgi:phosphoenolpyruvate synthase/pyruvate phosphate dikinase